MKENEFKFIFTDVKKTDIIEFKKFLDACGCKTEFFSDQSKNNNTMGTELSDIIITIIESGALNAVFLAIGIWIQRHREGKMIIDTNGENLHIELENCTEKERDKVREWCEEQSREMNKKGEKND